MGADRARINSERIKMWCGVREFLSPGITTIRDHWRESAVNEVPGAFYLELLYRESALTVRGSIANALGCGAVCANSCHPVRGHP